jgi:hypothetical protein
MKAVVEGDEEPSTLSARAARRGRLREGSAGPGWQRSSDSALLSARARNFEWLRLYKLEHGCIDCGYRAHAVALDFDHRPDEIKLFQLAAAGGRTTASIRTEAAKCDVRCANCHRVVTAARRKDVGVPLSQEVVQRVRAERQSRAVYKAREALKAGRPAPIPRTVRAVDAEHTRCSACSQVKANAEFGRNASCSGGLNYSCRACVSDAQRRRLSRRSDAQRLRINQLQKLRRSRSIEGRVA